MSRKQHHNQGRGSEPDPSPITAALDALVNAGDRDQAYQVLEAQRSLLLSNAAVEALRGRIAHLTANPIGAGPQLIRLEAYLELLEDARTHGIAAAWASFTARQDQEQAAAEAEDALADFLDAPTWDAALHALENGREALLSDTALTMLRQDIAAARDDGDIEDAEQLAQRLELLEDARERGIHAAWETFEQQLGLAPGQREAEGALWELLDAETMEEAYDILEERQEALLSDVALARLRADVAAAHASGNDMEAEDLERFADMLEDARARGIPAAWKDFTEQQEREAVDQLTTMIARDPELRAMLEGLAQTLPETPGELDELLAADSSLQEETDEAVEDALWEFLEAPSRDAARQVLEKRQDVMLSDAMLTLLRQMIVIGRLGGSESVKQVRQALHLLEDARARGIPAAWQSFVAALDAGDAE